jgi:hypothetical protein
MRALIMALVFLLIGAAVGGVLALGFGTGMGAAGGVLLGAQAGVCLAAETAREQAGLDDGAMNALISSAIGKIRAKSQGISPPSEMGWIGDAAGCKRLLEQFDKGTERKAG